MEKRRETLVNIIVVFICLLLINGGGSLFISGSNDQFLLKHDLTNEIEIPLEQHYAVFSDDEKCPGSQAFDFNSFHHSSIKFLFTLNSFSQEFSTSIWQPPEFV